MPKSKRDKKVSLTKTNKKGLALKQKIVEDVRNCVEMFKNIYVFTFGNMRNVQMKEVREQWKPSRFFFGKNKVVSIGLGRTKEEEVQDDIHKIASCLKGQSALLFTNNKHDEVIDWFKNFSTEDFARSGFKTKTTIILKEGPLKQFPHSSEPYLRQLGMPTKLDRGVVTLIKDFEVCRKNTVITPEQARILKLLDNRITTFKLVLKAKWTKGKGFEKIENNSDSEDEENEEAEEHVMEEDQDK